jgi:serine/threonine protein kinase
MLCEVIYNILDLLKRELGKGGFSTVWLCEDSSDGKEYAIKEICITEKTNKAMVEKELDVSKKIGSEHDCSGLVHIYDCFKENEKYYIVIEYCKNGSLSDLMERKGNFLNEKVSHIY